MIAATVVLRGLTGGLLARYLGLSRPRDNGYVILGANALARALGKLFADAGEDVVLIDTNADSASAAERAGLRVLFGSGLRESIQARAELESRKGIIALTPSDSTNLLFVKAARKGYKVTQAWATLHDRARVTPENLHDAGGRLAFGRCGDIDHWITHLERATASLERWKVGKTGSLPPHALPLLHGRDKRIWMVDAETKAKTGDTSTCSSPRETADVSRGLDAGAGLGAPRRRPADRRAPAAEPGATSRCPDQRASTQNRMPAPTTNRGDDVTTGSASAAWRR
ncbi:MAG: NAD(P)-binding protein [bacterium]